MHEVEEVDEVLEDLSERYPQGRSLFAKLIKELPDLGYEVMVKTDYGLTFDAHKLGSFLRYELVVHTDHSVSVAFTSYGQTAQRMHAVTAAGNMLFNPDGTESIPLMFDTYDGEFSDKQKWHVEKTRDLLSAMLAPASIQTLKAWSSEKGLA